MTPVDMARIIVAVAAFGVLAVAWALSGDETPDADQYIGLDTAYARPEPAPSEPFRDSLSLCRVRAIQVGADIPMRPPYRLHFRACESAVDGHGPWRELVGR